MTWRAVWAATLPKSAGVLSTITIPPSSASGSTSRASSRLTSVMGLSTLSTTSFSVKMVTLPVSISTLASTCWFWDAFTALRYAEAMASSSACRITSRGRPFSSSTSLKARVNSFFILILHLVHFALDTQKSGGRPLFGVCDIAYSTHCILAQTGCRIKVLKRKSPPRLVIE